MSEPTFSYPAEFSNRVKQEFPEDKELHDLLDNGSRFHIGYTLLENGKTELYEEWGKIMLANSKKAVNIR